MVLAPPFVAVLGISALACTLLMFRIALSIVLFKALLPAWTPLPAPAITPPPKAPSPNACP